MTTRQEYLDGLVSHEQYYAQFVDQGLLDFVARHFTVEKLLTAYLADKDLNTIPLQRWDNLAHCIYTDKLTQQTVACGDFPTLGNAVCILKQAARIIVERVGKDTVFPSAKRLLDANISCRQPGRGGWSVYWMEGGTELTYFSGSEGPQEANSVDEIIEWIGGDQPAVLTAASLKRLWRQQ